MTTSKTFTEKFTQFDKRRSLQPDYFNSKLFYLDYFEFLKGHNAFPLNSKIADSYLVGISPWENDIFTEFKVILQNAIIANLPPYDRTGTNYVQTDTPYSIMMLYHTRRLLEPPEKDFDAIIKETDRVAKSYATYVKNHLQKNSTKILNR